MMISRIIKGENKLKFVTALILTIILVVIPFFGVSFYILSTMFSIFMFSILCVSWNIIGGYTGYLSFGHATFFGIGAYAAALLSIRYGVLMFPAIIAGGVIAMVLAAAIGYPCLRIKGPYFAVVTFATVPLFRSIFSNVKFLGRAEGLFPKAPYSSTDLYLVALAILAATVILAILIENSKLGAGLRAIREEEDVADVMGINTAWLKLKAFALSAFFPGVIGGVYGFYTAYINPPTVFDEKMTILIVLFTILGGVGRWTGPLAGATLFVAIDRILRVYLGHFIGLFRLELLMPHISSGVLTLIIYGIAIVLVVMFLPKGILPTLASKVKSGE